jgi:hypothetical protein
MKNLELLLEGIQNIENQLIENEIIEDGDSISDAIGELKEKLYNKISKEGLIEFHNKLNELVDEYHHNIYLIDNVFKGIRIIETGLLDELNK